MLRITGTVRVLYEHGEPHGIRDDSGLICFFSPVTKFSGQEERYRRELQDRQEIADFLCKALHEADWKAVPTQELQKVVEMSKKPEPAPYVNDVPTSPPPPTHTMRQFAADIRQYEQAKISPEVTAQTLSAIVEGIAARQEKELVEGLRESLQQVSRPAPAINAAARERWFREALNRLLEEHGAAIEVISDGGHLATSLIQVTMNGEWDGEYNQVRQFAQFVL
jgi:hypothetical protein